MNINQPDLDKHPVASSGQVGDQVPVIDIRNLWEKNGTRGYDDAVMQIARACREWGFFQVVNHGIPAQLVSNTWQQVHHFFARPETDKASILRTRENPWGYYNNELTKNQRDKKEVFDFTVHGIDPIYGSENRWPGNDTEFQSTMENYLAACTGLSLKLLEAFCTGLKLPAEFMTEEFATGHTSFIRLNYYPVKDPMSGSDTEYQPDASLGVHHHSDAGALTVLLQDEIGGLQVHRDGFWHDIPPVPGALVINTGDMMQVWSNDLYQAAVHRVLAMHDRDRYSIPFFFNPSVNTIVSPLPTVVSKDRPALYRPIKWSEFRGSRTDGDYADYGTEVQISQFRVPAG